MWVVNKTGVALAYRAAEPKNDGNSEAVAVRRPNKACYRTDGDSMLFSRCINRVTRKLRHPGGTGVGNIKSLSTSSELDVFYTKTNIKIEIFF